MKGGKRKGRGGEGTLDPLYLLACIKKVENIP